MTTVSQTAPNTRIDLVPVPVLSRLERVTGIAKYLLLFFLAFPALLDGDDGAKG